MADRKYSDPKCAFTLRGDHVETDETVKGKVTGTMMGGILGKSPFSSPFLVACDLLGIGREDLDGKLEVEIGKFLEPKLIDYCAERYQDIGAFVKAEEVFEKRDGDHDSWASDWEDDTFAGHLDGVVVKSDGNYVLEVKTTGNIASWENGVPENYLLQVALYNYFMYKKDKAYIILGIVDDETRKDMESWTPNDDNVLLFEVPMDEQFILQAMVDVTAWREQWILCNACTPPYDPANPRDVDMWNHLVAISAAPEDIQSDLDSLEELSAELAEKKAEIKPLEDQVDALQKKIKEYMVTSNKMELTTTSGTMRGVITHSVRMSVDKKKLIQAGIDPEPYMTKTEVNSFSFKRTKE